ncbi:MAG: hypothetical protein NTX96_03265 [Candidatus Zambryskibacteria bacterium]|nr:hypothetical protein [Candidatus Zambryskibacteria bacterium]
MNANSIVLIGMSNVGKSRRALLLEGLGFNRVCCDNEIEKKLKPYLLKSGYQGIDGVAEWLGQPFDERYVTNSALYLQYEIEVMQEIISRLRQGEKLVVDTTGSVIYIGADILSTLKELATIVLLDAPQSLQDELYQKYLTKPKPVLWGDGTYAPIEGEEPLITLKRCYPELLRTRNIKYHNLSHIILDYQEIRAPGFTAENLLQKIESK